MPLPLPLARRSVRAVATGATGAGGNGPPSCAVVNARGMLISSSMFSSMPQKRENGSAVSGICPGKRYESSGGSELELDEYSGERGDSVRLPYPVVPGTCGAGGETGGVSPTGRKLKGGTDRAAVACTALGPPSTPPLPAARPTPDPAPLPLLDVRPMICAPTALPSDARRGRAAPEPELAGAGGVLPRRSVNSALVGDATGDGLPTLLIRRSRSRASLRCCVVSMRSVRRV